MIHIPRSQQLVQVRRCIHQSRHHLLDVGQLHPYPSLTLGQHQGGDVAGLQLQGQRIGQISHLPQIGDAETA